MLFFTHNIRCVYIIGGRYVVNKPQEKDIQKENTEEKIQGNSFEGSATPSEDFSDTPPKVIYFFLKSFYSVDPYLYFNINIKLILSYLFHFFQMASGGSASSSMSDDISDSIKIGKHNVSLMGTPEGVTG